MAKSKKAQKKVDFNKVRFKIGKKLPKNLNETRTDFKAKSLIIKQQFSTTDRKTNEPVSHRNLTLKELFTNLNHHNVNTRLDAITSIRDMCQENKELVGVELSTLLEHVCLLFNDREHKIRKVAIQLLSFILHLDLDRALFKPYFNLLNAHLSCSMTHIDENIQNSSLQILDLLIQYLPSLILNHYSQIFESFIEQISKLSTTKSNGKTKRVLKNDPYKLTSTQAWRSNVLTRIYKLISLLTNEYRPQVPHSMQKREENIQMNNDSQVKMVIFSETQQKESFKLQIVQNSKQFSNDIHLFFKDFVHILGPLLIDCWIEAKPEDSNIIENTQSLDIMFAVLSILNLIVAHLDVNFVNLFEELKINKKSNRNFESLFLSNFPYVLAENFTFSTENSSNQVSIKTTNLLLCKLTASSLIQLNNEKLLSIFEYCLEVFETQTSSNELNILLTICSTIFKNYSSPELIKPYLNCLLDYFDKIPMQSTSKFILFQFLSEKFYTNTKLHDHNKNLINFFTKSINYLVWNLNDKKQNEKIELVINSIRKLLTIKQTEIRAYFQNEYISLLNFAIDDSLSDSTKKKLIELISYLPKITNFILQKLSIFIINQKFSIEIVTQILTILQISYKYESICDSDYFTFILTLYNGYTGFDLTTKVPQNLKFYCDSHKFNFQVKLLPYLNQFLMSQDHADKIHDVLMYSCLPIFDELTTCPLSTANGLLNLIKIDSFGNSQAYLARIHTQVKHLMIWLNENITEHTIDQCESITNLIASIKLMYQFNDIQQLIEILKSKIYP